MRIGLMKSSARGGTWKTADYGNIGLFCQKIFAEWLGQPENRAGWCFQAALGVVV
jgi:hypothetical protein